MISSTANSRVKRVALLREKSRERLKENVFIVEGVKMFEEAPADKIREIYYVEEKLFGHGGHGLSDSCPGLKEKIEACARAGAVVETVTGEVLLRMSDVKSPQGILCVMERLSYDSGKLVERALARRREGHSPLFLLLEDIQDPGNLGTMIRTAEGAGADGIFMTGGTVDIYNPKTIRATMGSLYRVPFVRTHDLAGIAALLRENGVTIYAAHPKGENDYRETDYSAGSAFLIGNEGGGLKEETAELADCYLKIPMEGELESLNAAVAAALLMYRSRQ